MSEPLRGPDDRYRVIIEVLAARRGESFTRHTVMEGEPVWDVGGQGGRFLVLAGEDVSLVLVPGENGLTVRSLRLLNASRAVVTATVTPGSGAPDWLPNESTYLLFQGDRDTAATLRDRYVPLEGMVVEQVVPAGVAPVGGGVVALPAPAAGAPAATPAPAAAASAAVGQAPVVGEPAAAAAPVTTLDQLAVAVGRSVARANAILARTQADAGVGLVASVTVRVCVTQVQTDQGQGRVLVTPARPGEPCNEFVELAMTTVPGAAAPAAAPTPGTATAAPAAAPPLRAVTPQTAPFAAALSTAPAPTPISTPQPLAPEPTAGI